GRTPGALRPGSNSTINQRSGLGKPAPARAPVAGRLAPELLRQVRSGIHELTVLADLEVDMRAGGPSGRAAQSDHLPLLHLLPRGHQQLVQVPVQRQEPVTVV